MEKTAFLAIFRPFIKAITKSFVETKRDWNWKKQSLKVRTVSRGTKWHQKFFSSSKIVGGDTLWNFGKNKKKNHFLHTKMRISQKVVVQS